MTDTPALDARSFAAPRAPRRLTAAGRPHGAGGMRSSPSTARLRYVGIVVAVTGLSHPASVTAQFFRDPIVVVGAGVSAYDLSGTGTVGIATAGVTFAPTAYMLIEPSMTFLRYDPQLAGGQHVAYLFPEVSVQAQIPGGAIRPYLGVGIGAAATIEGPSDHALTLNGGLGVRVWTGARWGARLEGRLRSVEPFHGLAADLTLALLYRLRSR